MGRYIATWVNEEGHNVVLLLTAVRRGTLTQQRGIHMEGLMYRARCRREGRGWICGYESKSRPKLILTMARRTMAPHELLIYSDTSLNTTNTVQGHYGDLHRKTMFLEIFGSKKLFKLRFMNWSLMDLY